MDKVQKHSSCIEFFIRMFEFYAVRLLITDSRCHGGHQCSVFLPATFVA
jgi:hypothetical protein